MSWPTNNSSGNYAKLPTAERDNDNDPFLKRQMSSLRQQKQEQDENLSILGDSVERLGQLSLSISKEIDSQNVMLDDLSDEVDTAKDTADMLTKKTEELVKAAGGKQQFCIILILTAILIVLTLLVLYT